MSARIRHVSQSELRSMMRPLERQAALRRLYHHLSYFTMLNRTLVILGLISVLNTVPAALAAEVVGLEYTKSHYTKYEYRIPMRDGKRLFTAVYVPKDKSQAYPILMTRTPYSVRPYGADQYRNDLGPSPLFT